MAKDVRGNKTMPCETFIKNYNTMCVANNNGDYLGGCFSWICSSCISLNEGSSKRNAPDRISILETLVTKSTLHHETVFKGLSETISSLNRKIQEMSFSATDLGRSMNESNCSDDSSEYYSPTSSSTATPAPLNWSTVVNSEKRSRTPAQANEVPNSILKKNNTTKKNQQSPLPTESICKTNAISSSIVSESSPKIQMLVFCPF